MSYKQAMKHWHNHRKQRFTQPIVLGFSIKKSGWFCDGCQHDHRPETTRFITLDGRALCLRMFAKEK